MRIWILPLVHYFIESGQGAVAKRWPVGAGIRIFSEGEIPEEKIKKFFSIIGGNPRVARKNEKVTPENLSQAPAEVFATEIEFCLPPEFWEETTEEDKKTFLGISFYLGEEMPRKKVTQKGVERFLKERKLL